MPVFVAMIAGALIRVAGTIAGRVLIGLGIGVVTYTGFSAGLDGIRANALSSFSALPAEVVSILGLMKVGVCISIISSAVAARLVIQGLTGDTLKRWVLK